MKLSSIRDYGYGGPLNIADGLNPKVFEYSREIFINKMFEYLSGPDKHCYISQYKAGDSGNRKEIQYCTTIASFDIEVSSVYINGEKRSIPYIWQIAIQDYVFYGRHFDDIVEMFDTLHKIFDTNSDKRLIVWVHNLAYEFQFIRKYFKWLDVFLLDERKPIKALSEIGIEFRCSYLLSGMSLADLGSKGIHQGKVQKMVGDLDYSLIRHEKTKLTDEELLYCINDVLVVVEYITEQVNELYEGCITKLPATKTGAVRIYVRSLTSDNEDSYIKSSYRDKISRLTVELREYLCLTRAFAGGFTHANPNYIGSIIENVASADISSSYPAVLCMEKFPMSKGKYITINGDYSIFDKAMETGLLVFDVGFRNVKSKYDFEHILQSAKCTRKRKAKIDNNRIVSAEEIVTTMTSVDFKEFVKYYDFDEMAIDGFWYYEADYLPRELVEAILRLYVDKTKLKDVGQDLLYMLKKSNLNSVYGMMVMAILRELVEYDDENGIFKITEAKFSECVDKEVIKNVEDLYNNTFNKVFGKDQVYNMYLSVKKYNETYSRFLFYPWGVFVTSYARQRLQDFILKTANDHVYSDTDSDKFMNVENHLQDIEDFNREIDKKIDAICDHYFFDKSMYYPEDIKGVKHPLGYFENETGDHPYRRFKTLGAKRYLVEKWNKKKQDYEVEVTCAGVNKKKGSKYIASQDEPFVFFDDYMTIGPANSGKTTAAYIDTEEEFDCTDYNGVTDHCIVKSGIHIEPTSFELKIDPSFKRFLCSIENKKYITRR